ncbi:MAG: aminoacyl-tRNA hydrolase [Rudaea sp.]
MPSNPFRPSARWLARHLGREEKSRDDRSTKLIVGLGNPGVGLAGSRHNAGFMVVERFAEGHGISFSRRRFSALLGEGAVRESRLLLAKPQTYMNLSGKAVSKLVSFFRVPVHDIIVVYDDLDLPLGRIRLRARGSAGGHHGMESIISTLGTSDFARLRVGIGRPGTKEDIDHVLGRFSSAEQQELDEAIDRAEAALDTWLAEGIETAMNRFNA